MYGQYLQSVPIGFYRACASEHDQGVVTGTANCPNEGSHSALLGVKRNSGSAFIVHLSFLSSGIDSDTVSQISDSPTA